MNFCLKSFIELLWNKKRRKALRLYITTHLPIIKYHQITHHRTRIETQCFASIFFAMLCVSFEIPPTKHHFSTFLYPLGLDALNPTHFSKYIEPEFPSLTQSIRICFLIQTAEYHFLNHKIPL